MYILMYIFQCYAVGDVNQIEMQKYSPIFSKKNVADRINIENYYRDPTV